MEVKGRMGKEGKKIKDLPRPRFYLSMIISIVR